MNVRRMKRLAKHLQGVPRRGFYMGTWIGPSYDGKRDEHALMNASKHQYECGMTACVGGHACLLFPELTLGKLRGVRGGTYWVARTLGLCLDHAEALVRDDAPHQTPKAAARFILNLVKKRPDCCK